MIPHNQNSYQQLSVNLTPITNIKSRLSRSVISENANKLLLEFGSFSGNYYYQSCLKIDKKIVSERSADTRLGEFNRAFMRFTDNRKNKGETHSYVSTDPSKCKFCKSDKVSFSAGIACHSLRADCRFCRKTWWVSKDDASELIESGQITLTQQGKQLSLFGGEADA